MGIITELFTWWTGNTIGTRIFTWRKGEFVGEDEFGNRYYKERNGSRRWVTYKDLADASKVPADWHGWLHHTVDTPPTDMGYRPKSWQRPHLPNMTGTNQAYRPPGSTLGAGKRAPATGDYEAWRPKEG